VDHNLKAFIPSHRILRTGIVRDISQDFSIDVLKEAISSPFRILEIHRLNRRVKTGNEFQYVPSRTICIKFTGQQLPSHIGLFNCRYPIFPFVPKARICFSCFRIGHLSKACKSNPRCLLCGDSAHISSKDCPNSSLPAKCINCEGAHLVTSHDCPEVTRHKMALSLATAKNISYSEVRRSVTFSSPPTFPSYLSSDPKFDFLNFPLLSHPRSFPSPPPPLTNRFSPLSNLSQDPTSNYSDKDPAYTHSRKPYSQAVQLPGRFAFPLILLHIPTLHPYIPTLLPPQDFPTPMIIAPFSLNPMVVHFLLLFLNPSQPLTLILHIPNQFPPLNFLVRRVP